MLSSLTMPHAKNKGVEESWGQFGESSLSCGEWGANAAPCVRSARARFLGFTSPLAMHFLLCWTFTHEGFTNKLNQFAFLPTPSPFSLEPALFSTVLWGGWLACCRTGRALGHSLGARVPGLGNPPPAAAVMKLPPYILLFFAWSQVWRYGIAWGCKQFHSKNCLLTCQPFLIKAFPSWRWQ